MATSRKSAKKSSTRGARTTGGKAAKSAKKTAKSGKQRSVKSRSTNAGDTAWRRIVASSLDWHEAHAPLDDAVKGLAPALRGRRPAGLEHSPWELLEHIRLTQSDLAEFMENPGYSAPEWPRDYWPASPTPPNPSAWDDSIAAIHSDLERIRAIALRRSLDLASAIPWGDGKTYLRTILLAVVHSSYHVAQIIDARRLLGAWPG
jgi:hypothetical protein